MKLPFLRQGDRLFKYPDTLDSISLYKAKTVETHLDQGRRAIRAAAIGPSFSKPHNNNSRVKK